MPAITPSFLFDLETRMQTITLKEYERLTQNLWWTQIAKRTTSVSKKDRFIWLLDTASIRQAGDGGNIEFQDIVSLSMEVENKNANAGLKIKKEQFEDVDGLGTTYAAHWSREMGAYAAYWPQKLVAKAILSNPKTYDGKTFFNLHHPYNPYLTSAGDFANVLTGAAGDGVTNRDGSPLPTTYPGACPIDPSVTADVALNNLAKAIAYVSTWKMPNGQDPRFLQTANIFVPPALAARAQQLTNAKFLAQGANNNTGGIIGAGDVEAVIRNMGFGTPIMVPELASGFPGGSDTTYYIGMSNLLSDELGAFSYVDREGFQVLYYGPQNDAQLARIREYQWMTEGRNEVTPGHPFLLIKCTST